MFAVYDVKFFIDGQKTINYCKSALDDAVKNTKSGIVKPVDLVLTDYLMPFKNGIQVITEIRKYFDQVQVQYPSLEIRLPRFAINTAFKSQNLQRAMKKYNIQDEDCFEKPIPSGALRQLLATV